MEYAIEMLGITKRFASVVANDHVDLVVEKQEIHCLLGENGSGKSTLMNVLFGIYAKDEGEIRINGKKVDIQSPKEASDLGIGMVHQHFMLFPQNTVLENIILGDERSSLFLNYEKNKKDVKELIDKYDLQLNLNDKVCNLSVGMKQRVEILKVLYRGADIIIFDEPTSVLTPQESDMLMQMILNLRDQGKTIIFISHKLNETKCIGDKVTVLRKGQVAANVDCCEATERDLARFMVGKDVDSNLKKKMIEPGEVVFEIKDVSVWPDRAPCNLTVRKNEIVGIAGVDGNGQLELEELAIGLNTPCSGEIFLKGEAIGNENVLSRRMSGMSYVPSDRFKYAMLPHQSISRNLLLGNQERSEFRNKALIRNDKLNEYAQAKIEEFNVVTTGIEQPIGALSGGNQQKTVLSRELSDEAEFVIVSQPTMGLDIGAIDFTHNVILEKRNQGCAILLISADLSEVMALSDRIAVMYEGEIVAIGAADSFSREELGLLMAGHKEEKAD